MDRRLAYQSDLEASSSFFGIKVTYSNTALHQDLICLSEICQNYYLKTLRNLISLSTDGFILRYSYINVLEI